MSSVSSAMCHNAKCSEINVIMKPTYAACRYAECRYAECSYAECRYAECHYAKCQKMNLTIKP